MRAPIPQRIAPLSWRKPSFLCTPLALAIAIGWPAALVWEQPALLRTALFSGTIVFAVALALLGASWALGRAPKTRLDAVLHVVCAGALVSLLAPLALSDSIAAIAGSGDTANPSVAVGLAMAPLALIFVLPAALLSGALFAWVALARGSTDADA